MPEVLPPIEQLPRDVRPGVPLDQLAHNADWAETFAPSDVSFAQRFRHNRDIREYGEALQAQKAAAIEAQARTNQTAQNFFFRDKELDLKMREQEQDMRFKAELHPKILTLKEQQAQLARRREEIATNIEQRKIDAEMRMLDDADKLDAELFEIRKTHAPGTPEFRQAALPLLSKYRFAPPQHHLAIKESAKLSEEYQPVDVTTTVQELGPEGLDKESVVTTRRTTQKMTPGQVKQSTPMTGSDFLSRLGIKKRVTPIPAR